MVNEYKQVGPSRCYPFQFATRTKRYIDDIFTVFLGHLSGISLTDVILQEGTFYGLYLTIVNGKSLSWMGLTRERWCCTMGLMSRLDMNTCQTSIKTDKLLEHC